MELKKRILTDHTLEAVFSMPDNLFSNSKVKVVTCVMVFTAHQPHPEDRESFFGYFKDDGFVIRKKGRVDDGTWDEKKKRMLHLYKNRKSEEGLSVTKIVKAEDEWCAEAYMETDYDQLSEELFINSIKNYVAFQFLKRD